MTQIAMTELQAASPACTELETIVLDWLGKIDQNLCLFFFRLRIFSYYYMLITKFIPKGKAIGLPDDFLALKEGSKGGGVIQVGFIFHHAMRLKCI